MGAWFGCSPHLPHLHRGEPCLEHLVGVRVRVRVRMRVRVRVRIRVRVRVRVRVSDRVETGLEHLRPASASAAAAAAAADAAAAVLAICGRAATVRALGGGRRGGRGRAFRPCTFRLGRVAVRDGLGRAGARVRANPDPDPNPT